MLCVANFPLVMSTNSDSNKQCRMYLVRKTVAIYVHYHSGLVTGCLANFCMCQGVDSSCVLRMDSNQEVLRSGAGKWCSYFRVLIHGLSLCKHLLRAVCFPLKDEAFDRWF